LSAVTTNNDSNILAAGDITGWLNMPCFSHMLSIDKEVALELPDVSRALARCRYLVSYFNCSSETKID